MTFFQQLQRMPCDQRCKHPVIYYDGRIFMLPPEYVETTSNAKRELCRAVAFLENAPTNKLRHGKITALNEHHALIATFENLDWQGGHEGRYASIFLQKHEITWVSVKPPRQTTKCPQCGAELVYRDGGGTRYCIEGCQTPF